MSSYGHNNATVVMPKKFKWVAIHADHWHSAIANHRLIKKDVNKQTEDPGLNLHLEQVFSSQ